MVIRRAAIVAGLQRVDALLPEGGDGLVEQPAQLLRRARLDLMLGEVLIDELGERQPNPTRLSWMTCPACAMTPPS